MSNVQLALDIGTRKVLGLAFQPSPKGVQVLAAARQEHPGRAMRDGQIHDIATVAAVVRQVVADLAQACGNSFASVNVAAAGRALLTARGRAQQTFDVPTELSAAVVRQLEWEAVAAAQAALGGKPDGTEPAAAGSQPVSDGYYCVGYTVTERKLDATAIDSLAGHWGSQIELEALATFLPRGVVDALEAVLEQSNLSMSGLTLEPIAALEAAVPDTMRFLNLALVDVGAGTSDIAVTRDGAVCGYAMVPRAGDAFTEALAKVALLDFPVAERAKRRLTSGHNVRSRNAFGQTVTLTPADLYEAVHPVATELAVQIGAAIQSINGGPPQAVLLVGGGSQVVGFAAGLADVLSLHPDRVVVCDRKVVRGVEGARGLRGPDAITPLGIALLASRSGGLPLVRVQVADRWVRLFQPGNFTVGEALRAAGVARADVIGRPGSGITITVNGQLRILPGQRAVPGKVWVDGRPASLDTVCADRSRISWSPAEDGAAAAPLVRDLLKAEHWRRVIVNGSEVDVPPFIRLNGETADLDHQVPDRAVVTIDPCETVGDLAKALQLPELSGQNDFTVTINERPVAMPRVGKLEVDGRAATPATPITNGSQIKWSHEPITVRMVMARAGFVFPASFPVTVNGRTVDLQPPVFVRRNGKPVRLCDEVAAGDDLAVHYPVNWQPTLNEVLPPEITAQPPGQKLLMSVNGRPAGFTTPLPRGAEVEIRWESPSLVSSHPAESRPLQRGGEAMAKGSPGDGLDVGLIDAG